MWGRRFETWQKYFFFAICGICWACYFTYVEFCEALEKHNAAHKAKMKDLSKNILTPSQLRTLLKDRLEKELHEDESMHERIKRSVPNYEFLNQIDKKILELIKVVDDHNRKKSQLKSIVKRELTKVTKQIFEKRLSKSEAENRMTTTVHRILSVFTSKPSKSFPIPRNLPIILPWDKFQRDGNSGDDLHVQKVNLTKPKQKLEEVGRNDRSISRNKTRKIVEGIRRLSKRAIQEELTDEFIKSAGFQLSDEFLMSGPSKDIFVTNKFRTWLLFVFIQLLIFFACLMIGIVNSYWMVFTRVLNTMSFTRCLCRKCLQCKPREAVAEMAVKFFEFFDIEVDDMRDDLSSLFQKLLPRDFPAQMGRNLLTQLEPYRQSNQAIKHTYDKISEEVQNLAKENLEEEMEAKGIGKGDMAAEGIRRDDFKGFQDEFAAVFGGQNVLDEYDIKLDEEFYDNFYEKEFGHFFGETEEDVMKDVGIHENLSPEQEARGKGLQTPATAPIVRSSASRVVPVHGSNPQYQQQYRGFHPDAGQYRGQHVSHGVNQYPQNSTQYPNTHQAIRHQSLHQPVVGFRQPHPRIPVLPKSSPVTPVRSPTSNPRSSLTSSSPPSPSSSSP